MLRVQANAPMSANVRHMQNQNPQDQQNPKHPPDRDPQDQRP